VFIHIGGGGVLSHGDFRKIQKLVLKTILRDHSLKARILQKKNISTKPAFLNVFTSLQSQQALISRKQYKKKII